MNSPEPKLVPPPDIQEYKSPDDYEVRVALKFKNREHMQSWLAQIKTEAQLAGQQIGVEILQRQFRQIFLGEKS